MGAGVVFFSKSCCVHGSHTEALHYRLTKCTQTHSMYTSGCPNKTAFITFSFFFFYLQSVEYSHAHCFLASPNLSAFVQLVLRSINSPLKPDYHQLPSLCC